MNMSKQITINEIAQALDISPTTVSRALSNKGRVGETTRKKVLDYIKENNYIPNVRVQEYTGRRTKNICVVLPGEKDFAELPYFQKVMLSICDYFAVRDYNIMVVKITANDITALMRVIERHKADGVILTRAIKDDLAINYLQEKGVPFVLIGSYEDRTVYQVDVDQENACKEMTSILLGMGMRKIALFCADRTHTVTGSRYKGFVRAFQENSIPVDRNLIFDEMGYPLVAEKVIEDILKQRVECIMCMDDNVCLNVLNKLRKERVNIPQDIRIASFYNSSVLDSYYPPISCLEFDMKELGMTAAKMLFDVLEGNATSEKIVLGYRVILKDSTK